MFISVIFSMIVGVILRKICSCEWLVLGSVAVCAVLTEHFLTLHPSCVLKYITLPVSKGEKDEKN